MMKKNPFLLLLFAALAMAVMMGCEKDPIEPDPDVDPTLPKVLVAGCNLVSTDVNGAICWEEGVKTTLADGNGNTATCVFADGNDTYYGGRMDGKPTIWKNGVPQALSQSSGSVSDICVSNGKVYAVGSMGGAATLWVDGVAETMESDYQTLYPWTSPSTVVTAVTVANGKVYVVGYAKTSGTPKAAYLWVDGVCQMLSDGGGSAYDVFVDGTTVYVVGEGPQESEVYADLTVPALWTNGVFQDLTPANETPTPGRATCICVDNHIPYVSFYRRKGATWDPIMQGYVYQNGSIQEVACKQAYAVFKKDGDLYVGGIKEQWVGDDLPVLLKNNVEQTLGSGTDPARVNAIYVR